MSKLDKFWWYLVFWAALQIASYIPFMHAWKRKIFAPNNILLPIALVLMAAYELAAIFGLFMTSILHWFSSGSKWIFECFFPENLLKFWSALTKLPMYVKRPVSSSFNRTYFVSKSVLMRRSFATKIESAWKKSCGLNWAHDYWFTQVLFEGHLNRLDICQKFYTIIGERCVNLPNKFHISWPISSLHMNDAFNAEELVGFNCYLSQRPLSSKTIVFFREFGNVHAVQGALAEI